ncbi:MAG TPA: inosine/xanthosine triphosphatase [Candidatus Paceibacterota bacterium]
MKLVVVASENPVKIETVKQAFAQCFPKGKFEFRGVRATSGVPAQPLTDETTLEGACNRARHAKELVPKGDFFVGLEGGVEDGDGLMQEFAWIVVADKAGRVGAGKTMTFFLPEKIRQLVLKEGKEVGEACDIVFKEQNSKQRMGAIGLLTGGVIDRTELYRHAVVSALIPFIHPKLY